MYTSRAILAVSVFLVVGDAFRKKSSKTDAELEEGSFVEAEANKKAAERAQTLKDMKALAHKVVAGEEKIYDRTLKLLEKLRVVINQAEEEVPPQRVDQQAELDDARARFDSCIEAYMSKTEEINENEGKRATELGDSHNKSRYNEQAWLKTKAKDCAAFQEEFAPPDFRVPPKCVPFPDKCDWDGRKDCIEAMAKWSNDAKKIYEPMKVKCEKANAEHEKASDEAKKLQGKFEWEQCRWDTELNDACDYFKNVCWDKATENREKVHARIYSISEPALLAECIAIRNIQCYLDVLNTTESGMPAKLEDCIGKEQGRYLDDCRKTNKYHDIPARPKCQTVEVPCDENWRQKTYVSQSWFEFAAGEKFCHVFDGPQIVKPIKCLEGCEPDPPLPTKCTASVYQHANFSGNVATFSVGEYKHDDFVSRGPLQNDKASSIKVQGPPTCKATVYQHDNFKGWHAEFPVGKFDYEAFLAHGAKNDQASSIKVTLG
jgi:hypothetical protein